MDESQMPGNSYLANGLGLILLVDDSTTNTRLLQQALNEYDTLVASNGMDAVKLALSHQPDVILLDIQLPDMDGFQVCRSLKKNASTKDIPVIFLTGLREPGSVARAFQAGAVDYITKPFDFSEVKVRISTHLALCRTRRELEEQNRVLERTVKEQLINISLARNILGLINGSCPRYVELGDDLALFCEVFAVPCLEEGGDHHFARELGVGDRRRTVLSVKDQSGHSVNCVLRSITTDLFHNAFLAVEPDLELGETLSRLNNTICRSRFFADDDFCTMMTVVLQHQDLRLTFASAGHPPFLLIRDGVVRAYPEEPCKGNLPMAIREKETYRHGSMEMRSGDKLLLYTDGLLELGSIGSGRPMRQRDLVKIVQAVVDERVELPVGLLARQLLAKLCAKPFGSRSFKESLADDVTLLAAEIEPARPVESWDLFPADYPSIDRLIEEAVRLLGLSDDSFVMALSEALLNAWQHGNELRPELPIRVGCWRGNDCNISIRDQGPGFDPLQMIDPTDLDGLQRTSGRGIFIVRKFSSWVRWRDSGRQVVLSGGGPETLNKIGLQSPCISLWSREKG